MLSLTALLASLPPASLAETDLARFAAQAIGRRAKAELPGLAALFGEETLRGYPPRLGAILQALVETVIQVGLDPHELDARTVDGLLGGSVFLGRLGDKVPVGRQRLRPGTLVHATLRQTLGARLLVLPGVGRELMLVAPVDLAEVPEARFAIPLGVALARPAPADESEAVRAAWAVIEERFGLDGPDARRWGARFVAIARRENHDAEAARAGLATLTAAQRHELWEALVGHLRDQELPEQHRPGRRGLERRLGSLGLDGVIEGRIPAWVEATLSLCESAYRGTGLDPEVAAGRCPAPRDDVERWGGWVDVPAAGRERVVALDPTEIEVLLVALAEDDAGRVERPAELTDALARGLASLRDGCLRPRWQRSRWTLGAMDPLALADARIASGEDTHAIRRLVEALAQEAMKATPTSQSPGLGAAKSRTTPRSNAGGQVTARAGVRAPGGDEVTQLVAAVADEAGADRDPEGATGSSAAANEPAGPASEATLEPRPVEGDGQKKVRFTLPPLPAVPPPRPAPRVRPRTDFPPMPSIPAATPAAPRPTTAVPSATSGVPLSPDRATRAPRAPTVPRPTAQRVPSRGLDALPPRATEAPRARAVPSREASESFPSEAVSRGPQPRAASPDRPRTGRASTIPHLVTPTQGNEFYDTSFRELELVERDLVQRGPSPAARERIEALTREAFELHDALGPSARSGDREFLQAQKRIEKVQAYLERLRPLLTEVHPPRGTPASRDEPRPGFLGRLFGRK